MQSISSTKIPSLASTKSKRRKTRQSCKQQKLVEILPRQGKLLWNLGDSTREQSNQRSIWLPFKARLSSTCCCRSRLMSQLVSIQTRYAGLLSIPAASSLKNWWKSCTRRCNSKDRCLFLIESCMGDQLPHTKLSQDSTELRRLKFLPMRQSCKRMLQSWAELTRTKVFWAIKYFRTRESRE